MTMCEDPTEPPTQRRHPFLAALHDYSYTHIFSCSFLPRTRRLLVYFIGIPTTSLFLFVFLSFFPLLAHCLLPPLEKITLALHPMFLLIFVQFFISLLGAPFLKLFRGIAPWYVTPLMVQLVFVLLVYVLHILLLLVTIYMSLHVEFVWFKIVLMDDIASRQL